MTYVTAGTWIQDCDPRYHGRKVMITHTGAKSLDPITYAFYYNGKHSFSIRLDRIHDMDYKGKKGWRLTNAPGV